MKLRCLRCGNQTVDSTSWWLDRWFKFQTELVANKVKYNKAEYIKKYNASQRHIERLEPWYRTVKD